MRLLLDTHVMLWAMLDDARLTEAARKAIEDTPDGITSARRASLPVLALTTQFPSTHLLSSVATLTAPDLLRLPPRP